MIQTLADEYVPASPQNYEHGRSNRVHVGVEPRTTWPQIRHFRYAATTPLIFRWRQTAARLALELCPGAHSRAHTYKSPRTHRSSSTASASCATSSFVALYR